MKQLQLKHIITIAGSAIVITNFVIVILLSQNLNKESNPTTYNAKADYATPGYPLKVSANKRYLVEQNGTPFFVQADTAWTLFSNLTTAEAIQYLDARKAQGFNTVLVSVTNITSGGIGNTSDKNGNKAINGDISKPNAAYFDHVAEIADLANQRGMQLAILPLWLQLAAKDGTINQDVTSYGKWMGTRFSQTNNIIWVMGGDWGGSPEGTCPDTAQIKALATAIKSTDSRHLMTYHPGYDLSSSLCYNSESWLDFHGTYWDFNDNNMASAYRNIYRDYNTSPTRPTIMLETGYEGPFPNDENPDALTSKTSRMQSYYMVLAGGLGLTYGANSTYEMVNGKQGSYRTWQETLTIPGGFHQKNVGDLFKNKAWWKLVPDQNHSVVTAGYGSNGQQDYVTAGRADDGSLVIAYLPTPRSITVDMTKMNGAATAKWYDPTNASFTTVSGSPFPNTGTKQFSPSGNNNAGDNDWIFVLETNNASPGTSPIPTNISPTFTCLGNCLTSAPTAQPSGVVATPTIYSPPITPDLNNPNPTTSQPSPFPTFGPDDDGTPGRENFEGLMRRLFNLIIEFLKAIFNIS